MPKTPELALELASLRSDWLELNRACAELPEGLHIYGLMHIAMTRLDDRITILQRSAGQSAAA